MKTLFILFLILSSIMTYASDNKEGGNGQLVVIPKGHTKPVPYEVVRAWETGKYRNFSKLPCMEGVIEPRAEFNRDYACHALPWLALVKDLVPSMYHDLMKAADTTHFNIINHYIMWENKPYPDGEINYKKYEKAAFFNGEIIFSTLVMDNIGPLANVLTKEQNQGYIVLHELINAVYTDEDVKWKFDLGEVFLQQIMFKQSRADVLLNLALINLDYLNEEKDLDLLKSVFEEFKAVRPNTDGSVLDARIFMIDNYLKKKISLKDAYISYLSSQKIKDFNDYKKYHRQFIHANSYAGSFIKESSKFFTAEFLTALSQKFNIPLYTFKDLDSDYWDVLKPSLQNAQKTILMKSLQDYFAGLATGITKDYATLASDILGEFLRDETGGDGADYWAKSRLEKLVRDIAPRAELKKYEYTNWDNYDADLFVGNNIKEIIVLIKQSLATGFESKNFDFHKTCNYLKWRHSRNHNDWDRITLAPALSPGDQLYFPKTNQLFIVKKIDSNRKGYYTVVLKGTDKLKVTDIDSMHDGIILKAKGNK